MNCDHVVTLISTRYEPDELAQQVPVETRREVFCRKFGVSQSEFFSAGRAGLKAQHKLTMFTGDYEGEAIAELDGVRYDIYRTYPAKHDRIELYLKKD